jgi:hypothetical protein
MDTRASVWHIAGHSLAGCGRGKLRIESTRASGSVVTSRTEECEQFRSVNGIAGAPCSADRKRGEPANFQEREHNPRGQAGGIPPLRKKRARMGHPANVRRFGQKGIERVKVNFEIELPTELIVWHHPDKVKAACPSTGRLPVLIARDRFVGAGVYMNFQDEFWIGEEKLKPHDVHWWAKIPLPPGCSEADPWC